MSTSRVTVGDIRRGIQGRPDGETVGLTISLDAGAVDMTDCHPRLELDEFQAAADGEPPTLIVIMSYFDDDDDEDGEQDDTGEGDE
jgi:hypothetical protein